MRKQSRQKFITFLLCSSITLSLTACGQDAGDVNAPPMPGAPGLTSPGGDAGLTPLTPLEDEGFEDGGEEFVEEGSEDGGEEFVEEGSEEEGSELTEDENSELAEEVSEDDTALDSGAEDLSTEEEVDDALPDLEEGADDALADLDEGGDIGELPDLGGDGSEADSGAPSSFSLVGNLTVDRDKFNQWQAVNIVSNGSSIYVAAVDQKSPTKGTVIEMDTSSGENWKNLGRGIVDKVVSFFSGGFAGYKLPKTIRGIALDPSSGNVIVNDSNQYLYQLTSPDFSVTKQESNLSQAIDLTANSSGIYVATANGVKKYSSSLTGGSNYAANVVPTGGIGTDSQGNLFVVSGNKIQKIDVDGNTSDVITSELKSPIDVAVSSNGHLYVIDDGMVKEFESNGTKKSQFGGGDFQRPMGIAIDNSGSLYVADFGTSHADSQIMKYESSGQ